MTVSKPTDRDDDARPRGRGTLEAEGRGGEPGSRGIEALRARIRDLEAEVAALAGRCRAGEAALRRSEEHRRLLAQAVTGVIYDWDLLSGEVRHSEGLNDLLGIDPARIEPQPGWWMDRIHPEDLPRVERASRELLEGAAGQLALEYRVRHEDGRWIWIWDRSRALRDSAGRSVRLVGISTDITARKQAEAALRESEVRFRCAIEEAPIPVMMYAETGELLAMSRTVTRITGYTREELTDLNTWLKRAYGLHADRVRKIVQAYFKDNAPFPETEFIVRTAHGSVRIWRFTAAPPEHLADGRRYIVAFAMDVTDRKQAEAALRESEERLRLALEAAELGIWDVDLVAGSVRCDQRCRAILGLDDEASLTVADAMALIHEDDRRSVDATYAQAIAPDSPGSYATEKRIVWPDSSVRWVVTKGRVHFAGEGEERRAARMLGIAMDITDRKRAEQALRQAKEAAERANAAKSRFLAAASHDLRQPLQAVDLQRAVLSRKIADPEALQTVRELGLSLDVMRNTLNTLLDLSQLETGAIKAEIGEFRLGELFQRIGSEFRGLAAAKGLALRLVPTSAVVRSDPRLLERVLQNLVSNAVKYTQRGKILVGCRRRDGSLRIEVRDTGIGIAQDQLKAIFEEFYQAANAARERRFGLGLGLSIARAAAELLGSRLSVRSTPGKGSTFCMEVTFARRAGVGKPAPRGESAKTGSRAAGLATILLVEDDAAIRSGLQALLELEGYRVVAAANGPEALELVEQGAGLPAMAIVDQSLPGELSGVATVQRLRHLLEPHLPALVITGDVLPERLAAIRQAALPHLTKPVSVDELRILVRSLIGSQPPPPAPLMAPLPTAPTDGLVVHVVEDEPAQARGLRDLLAAAGRQVETYPSAEAFLQAYRHDMGGCLVVDLNLPRMSGLELQRELARRGGSLPCVFVTGQGELEQAVQAMREGAVDFLVKPVGSEALLESVGRALERSGQPAAGREDMGRLGQLTTRERKVIELVAAGLANKEIAYQLGISQRTVEGHRARAMHKLGVRTLAELVRLLLATGPAAPQGVAWPGPNGQGA
jgi:PAS domain S-box-containing protein